MKQILVVISILIVMNCKGQDTTKVLFIGNSFTSQNNLPALFSQIAQSTGDAVVVASHMPGGVSVGDISQGTSAHMNNPLVYSLIRSNNWDYLVLQDNQGRFCLNYGQFPSSSLVIEGHIKIRDSLLFYHPCAHIIWYAGFGPKNGYLPYASTGSALIDTIYQNYQFLRDTAGQIIAPIGPAFQKIISGYPSVNLWDTDDTHPSLNGSFLIANVIYTTIFKKSPILCSYNPGLASNVDSLLKNTAYQTTFDSLYNTGLLSSTPQISQTNNDLIVSGYQSCNWYFNDSPYASNNGTATITQPGSYYAITTDNNGCTFRTFEQSYILTGLEENSLDRNSNSIVYPNPAQEYIHIKAPQDTEIQILNIEGQLLHEIKINTQETTISLRNFSKGIYIIKIKDEKGIVIRKFIKE